MDAYWFMKYTKPLSSYANADTARWTAVSQVVEGVIIIDLGSGVV
jgi:hypothetical protein